MSSSFHGCSTPRGALLAVVCAFSFAAVAAARVPDECRKAPVSVRCVKALWRGAHETPKTAAAAAPDVPESSEKSPIDIRPPAGTPPPYAGPPPQAAAHPVHTPPLREMRVIPPPQRGETAEHREPARPPRPTDTTPSDVPRQNANGPIRSAPVSSGISFEGIGVGLKGFSVAANPPDVNGRVGATQYVQWNNVSFAVWDKTGKLLYGPAAGNTLFQPLGGVCASHNDGDPVVSYDILAGRWVLSQLVVYGSGGFSHQCVAVSTTSDATGSYNLYDFVTDPTNFVDYPHMAVWPDGYYMAAHIFDGSGSAFIAGRVYAFERDKMLSGQTARMLSADLKTYGGYPQYGFLAADLESGQPPPAGEAEFVLGPDPSTTSRLDSARVAVTWGTTPSITLTESTIASAWSFPPCVAGGRECVPQPSPAGSGAYLDNLDQHFMHRLAYRNFGGSPPQESLVANISVAGSSSVTPHGAVGWYEFRNDGTSTATPTIYQSGTFDPDTDYRWMGSIAMDKDHNIALGYSRSSTSTLPSIWLNGRLGTDPLNTLGTETQMQAGGGVQLYSSGNRWGDYSSMTLDPIDQCTFWYTNEYYPSNGDFNWATRIAAFRFPTCNAAQWGTVNGTITSCATGKPVPGVIVTLSNGYAGTSDATGAYSITAPVGTFSASAAAAGRNCSSCSPATVSIIVPSAGTVTQDFCMSGTPKLELGAVKIDDSVNGNNNGVVNRNECVDLNVTVANNGCAADSNITATLTTSTAGVTVTQGSSFFANLDIGDSAKSSVPFRFQTSSTFVCGTTIAFTLNVTSKNGSTALAFTLPSCTAGSVTIPTTSLTTSDPSQPDRVVRDGTVSDCHGKTCPGPLYSSGNYNYKTFTFSNPSAAAACVTVNVNAACGSGNLESVAYSGSTYTPPGSVGDPKICNNYLGDAGVSVMNGTLQYSFTVPAKTSFVVVMNTVYPPESCAQFSGTISGLLDDTAGPGACPTCTPPTTPTVTAAGATTFCAGGSVTLNSSAASGNQWYLNGGIIAGATGTSYVATAGGSYTVTESANGCFSAPSTAVVVTVPPTPAKPTASNGGPYCAGATIALSTAAVTGASYAWSGPNNFSSTQQNPTIANAALAAAGTYSVTVTANGCTSPAGTTSVVVNAIPATPVASNGGPYCEGATAALSTPAVTGATYAWTGPARFTSSLQNPTIPNATADNSGTYSVTITVNGCTSAAGTTNVAVSPIPFAPAATNGGPYCAGGTIALSTPTVTGAAYAWSGPNNFSSTQQNPTIANASPATAGTYSVTVTVNGCTSPAGTTSVVVNPIPATPTATNGGPYCERATIALSTPTVANATYAWTGPNGFTSTLQNPTRASATPADAGTYSVTVTTNGCTSAAGTTAVVVNAAPAQPSASNGGPYCEGSTIALSTPTVANATYAWSGPNNFSSTQQNPTIANATAANFGTYSVVLTVNGCTSIAGTTSVVDLNGPAVATNGGPYCAGGTIALSTPAVSGATYAWTGPNNFSSTQQNPTIPNATNAANGTYSLVVTSAGCTSQSGSTNVVVNSALATPTATNGGPYCEGSTIALSTPAVAGATYSWTGPNGFTSTLQNPTIPNATVAAAGTYSVTLFNGCTTAAGMTTVAVNAKPATPSPTNGGPYCAGSTIALSAPAVANASYAWSGPNGFTSTQQNPTIPNATLAAAGIYSVVVTVNGCASAAGTTSVAVTALPTAAPTNGGPYCEGATISLSTPAVTNATYAWTGPNGFTSSQRTPTRIKAVLADSGAYTVVVTANGCSSAPASTSVVVNAIPAAPTATNGGPYCPGNTIALSTPAVANATYSWSGPNNFASSLQNPTIANATPAAAGAYSVTVTLNGCTSPAGSTTVAMNATPATPTASNTGPYCPSNTISLSTPTVAGANYAWTGPGGFTSNLQNPTRASATAAMAGTYSVVVTVNGCPSAAGTTNVVVNPTPATPTASNTGPYCAGGTISLSTPTVAGASYAWTGPGGFTSTLQNPTRPSATAAMAGTYSVVITVNGCPSAAGSTNVSVNAVSSFIFVTSGSTVFCAGGSVTLSSNYISGNQWLLNGTPIPGATNQTYVATASGAYTHIATVNGCSSPPSNTITVTVLSSPSAAISGTSQLSAGAAGTEQVPDAGASASYGWTISNGTITSGVGTRSIAFTAGTSGSVSIGVAVTNSAGCRSSATTSVAIAPAVTSINPTAGRIAGGTNVTILGSGFQPGVTVAFGGVAATNVKVSLTTSITAMTPAHVAGAVDVVVTNPDKVSTTTTGGYTYIAQQFDPNNDHVIDPSDVFYLINYLFSGGPPPQGEVGMMSGDANGDGVVDPSDVFYLINYLYASGPAPLSLPPGHTTTLAGSIVLGDPIVRGGRTFVPVIVTSGAAKAHALSLHVRGANVIAIRRTLDVAPLFENAPPVADGAAWLASFGATALNGVVAEVEVTGDGAGLELDPALTMLTDQSGVTKATQRNGGLRLIDRPARSAR